MQKTDPIHLLSAMVAIDSQSHKSNKPIIDLLASWFPDNEKHIELWTRASDGLKGENLIVKIPGKSTKQNLIFVCHMDTVPTSESWETDPFILEEKEGNLYGLGTCDTKGGVASLIAAVKDLAEKPAYDTYLVFDGDEEVSTAGAKKFLKSFNLPNSHFIFIEPTDLQLAIGQRSILQVTITTQGVATHSSQGTPENNNIGNAINKMHHILHALSKDAEKNAQETDTFFGTSTQNFGTIQGGTAMNVFASHCKLVMERRLTPNKDLSKEFDHIKTIVHEIVPDAIVLLNEAMPSFSLGKTNPFAQSVLELTQKRIPSVHLGIFPAWSEAGLFAQKGDVVVLGPGSLVGQAHRANEYVSGQEVLQFVDVFKEILLGIKL